MNLVKVEYYQLSDYFIGLANVYGDTITNLKLQKMMYYVQSYHLTAFGSPLFDGKFQAWVHGPVLRTLYADYHDVKWNPIQKDINEEYLKTFEFSLDQKQQKLLYEVSEAYFGLTAFELERLTHSELPWIEARKGLPEDEPSENIISEDTMKEFYKQYWTEN